jgi:A118 family predicted phage portal protein
MSGDEDKLGRPMALVDHPETAPFALLVDAGDGQSITTGAVGLTAEYVPNMRPNRSMRGSPLGRSDYDGIEPILDALDESWTSWMRDLRLGKGRLIVPRSYLQGIGRGKGATFDAEREIFEAVDALASSDGGLTMQVVQFEIRVEQHARTCLELATQALRGAGYSAQTFGEVGDTAQTATEVTARQGASYRTRAKKLLYNRGPLARICRTLLEVDAAKFGTTGTTPELPSVVWPDGVAVDPETQATTLQLLAAAEAASIWRRVKILNPDWEDTEVDEEVDRIKEDTAPPPPLMPPGAGITGQGPDGPAPPFGGQKPPAGQQKPPAGNGGPPNAKTRPGTP